MTRRDWYADKGKPTQRWGTPDSVYLPLHAEFNFILDVAADNQNHKTPAYYTPTNDGLRQPWFGTCWCNPPYGKDIGRWVAKAWASSRSGATVVCLLPSRTDTSWWHEYVMRASEVRYLRGRLRFQGGTHRAPFGSVVVVFRPPVPAPVRPPGPRGRSTPTPGPRTAHIAVTWPTARPARSTISP